MHDTHNYKTRFVSLFFIFLFLVLITACGGGGDGTPEDGSENPNPSTINRPLSGTVAMGAPVEGTITIVDADGNTFSAQSDANGDYTVNLEGRSGPYLIRVEPNDSNLPIMYSYATSSGIANITPFTTLALFLAHKMDLEDAFIDWTTTASGWKRAQLEQALAKINANFSTGIQNAGADPTIYDFFTVPFDANQTGMDAFLENYNVSVDFGSLTYDISDSSGQAVAFNENIDTTGYYIGAAFIPDDAALWTFTLTYIIDDQENTVTYPNVSSNSIPWSEERFNEIFWNGLAGSNAQTFNCDDYENVDCSITWQVTKLEAKYNVEGNGEIGTEVTGEASYNWSMTGYIEYPDQPRQDIDESHTWTYSWKWKRTS
jgi:hypothetical protein